jgi:hypothetical protein
MLLSKRAYARHRAEKGLPGGTLAAIQRATREGRITADRGGQIDPDLADEAWASNTRVTTRLPMLPKLNGGASGYPPRRTKPSEEFVRGRRWQAQEICRIARIEWPAFMAELNFDFIPEENRHAGCVVFTATMLHLLEEWLADYIDADVLPPMDKECQELRTEWTAAANREKHHAEV